MSIDLNSAVTFIDSEGSVTSLTHLPVLLNPLVNAVFNCPNPNSSPFKKLFNKITSKTFPKFALLVPSSFTLFNYKDIQSNIILANLCHYDQNFLSSHIIQLDEQSKTVDPISPEYQYTFNTLNNVQVIINFNKKVLVTTNNSSFKKKCKILKLDTLTNFNDYFYHDFFTLIYIDQPLIDSKRLVETDTLKCFRSIQIEDRKGIKTNDRLTQDSSQQNRASFENTIRLHPQWRQRFDTVFGKFKNATLSLKDMSTNFHNIIHDFLKTMEQDDLFKIFGSDLGQLVEEYVEVNLYETIWKTLKALEKNDDCSEVFYTLNHLSIDQLETNFYSQKFEKFALSQIVKLEKNIDRAIHNFMHFKKTDTFFEKSKILIETLQILSEPLDSTPIDADTLLSLFVLIVNKTNTHDLICHLQYLQNFYYSQENSNATKFGILGYSISTLEAVTYYIDSSNTEKFSYIKEHTESSISSLLGIIENHNNVSPTISLEEYKDVLRYRNEVGESVLCLCIKHFQNILLKRFLTEFETEFPLEDLLDDETINGSTLLHQAFKHDNHQAALMLISLLTENCTPFELKVYLNKTDKAHRSIAHYLSNQSDILIKVGKYINWTLKDITGKTPLFTIFRSYDQTNYSEMVTTAFNLAQESYTGFSYSNHTDPNGNTLLHILKTEISILLNSTFPININDKNKKGLTPLMVFIKYNRLENIKLILNDKKLNFVNRFDTNKFLTCYDYIRNPKILDLITKYHIENGSIFKHCICHSLRVYTSPSSGSNLNSSLKLSTIQKNGQVYHTAVNIRVLKNIFKILLKKHPMIFVPVENALTQINNLVYTKTNNWLMDNLTSLNKFQNKMALIATINNCLDTLIELGYIPIGIFEHEDLLVKWMREERKLIVPEPIRKIREKKKDLEPEEINVIKYFLKFNIQELTRLKKIVYTLEKLLIFRNIKLGDNYESLDILKQYISDSQISNIRDSLAQVADINKIEFVNDHDDISLSPSLLNLEFLKKCIDHLYKNIEHLLNYQILTWWKNYGELIENNKILMKNSNQHVSTSTRSVSSGSNSGVFGNFLENQRMKTEQRILNSSHEITRQIESLSGEITKNHEELAEELSNFMVFKNKFLFDGIIKKMVIDNIGNLNENYLHIQEKMNQFQNI